MAFGTRLIGWLALAALWGCSDSSSTASDAGPDLDARPADGATADGSPADGGGADVFEVEPITCPPPAGDEPMAVPLEVQGPGRYRLQDCSGWVELRFTVHPNTAWQLEATADGPEPPIVSDGDGDPLRTRTVGGGENRLDTPQAAQAEVFFQPEQSPVVTLRWVDCWSPESCGADLYCSPETRTCVACADGDELFDTQLDPAPRTDASPREVVERRASGVVCTGRDDWYAVQVPAGQPLKVTPWQHVQVYVADPAAQTLTDLQRLTFEDVTPDLYTDAEDWIVRPTQEARTLWLRVTADGDTSHTAYRFELSGTQNSYQCLPWWAWDRAEEGACQPCEGAYDPHGDNNVLTWPGAEPTALAPGTALEGAICGVDEDWYAVTLGDPGSRIVITGGRGEVHVEPAGQEQLEEWLGAGFEDPILRGEVMVLRRDTPEWYPDLQAPDVVWVRVWSPQGEGEHDIPGTAAYTIMVEDGDFCGSDSGAVCPEGRACDEASGRCMPPGG